MEKYYKITKDQANLLTRFSYAPNQDFDPFVGEQVDGSYLVSEKVYELLKNREEFQKVDFSVKTKIEYEKLNTKNTEKTLPL